MPETNEDAVMAVWAEMRTEPLTLHVGNYSGRIVVDPTDRLEVDGEYEPFLTWRMPFGHAETLADALEASDQARAILDKPSGEGGTPVWRDDVEQLRRALQALEVAGLLEKAGDYYHRKWGDEKCLACGQCRETPRTRCPDRDGGRHQWESEGHIPRLRGEVQPDSEGRRRRIAWAVVRDGRQVSTEVTSGDSDEDMARARKLLMPLSERIDGELMHREVWTGPWEPAFEVAD